VTLFLRARAPVAFAFAMAITFASAAVAGNGPEGARPWLGVAIEKGASGVRIKDVLADTPAAGAGLTAGDEILSVDARAVHAPEELIKAVVDSGIGTTVTVTFKRGTETKKQAVQLVAKPDELKLLQQRLLGIAAPDFDLPVVSGKAPGKLAALKGQVVLVEFWATWCPACRSSHPQLSAFAAKHAGKIAVLAVSDEDEATIKAYTSKVKPAFTVLRDAKQKVLADYAVTALPELVVIGKDGKVVHAGIGAGFYLDQALAAAEKAL
jgi:thiol-disulfide isomerase/thioredoxin